MPVYQQTLSSEIECEGIGLHTGEKVALRLKPAAPDEGVRFVRTDLDPAVEIPARVEAVGNAALATTLANNGTRIGTVEHLLAALAAMGVDNVTVEVEGPEVPIMDGSAEPFVQLIKQAGLKALDKPRQYLAIAQPFVLRDGDRFIEAAPSDRCEIRYSIEFDHPCVAQQQLCVRLSPRLFEERISRARTFGFLKEIEMLWKNGLARGGSLENAVVLDEGGVLNPGGLRFPDEFVRHKILDFIGDIALAGMPLLGVFVVHKSGHALNHALIRRLREGAVPCRVVNGEEQAKTGLAEDPGTRSLSSCGGAVWNRPPETCVETRAAAGR